MFCRKISELARVCGLYPYPDQPNSLKVSLGEDYQVDTLVLGWFAAYDQLPKAGQNWELLAR